MPDDDMPVINPAGPQLVYVVVADHIAGQIADGRLPVGARLMGELAMAETYGIARMTAARAVRELRDRGLVITVRGKGTFVAEPPAGD
jgi:DNA-binding GntR family transcriptional regulator